MMAVESSPLVKVTCADYCQYVAIALQNLFDSRRGADFELKWEGMAIGAHRIILEMFLSTETMGCPVQDPFGVKQEVPDCLGASSNNVLEFLLEFLYKGEVTVPEGKLGDLLRASKELDFKMLEDALVQTGNPKVVKVENEIEIQEQYLYSSENIPSSSFYGDLGSRTFNNNPCVQVADQEMDVQSLCVQEIILDPHSQLSFECLGSNDSNFDADDDSSNPEQLQLIRKKIKVEAGEVLVGAHPQNDDCSETADGATGFEIAPSGATKLNKCSQCEFQTLVIKSYHQHMRRKHGINIKGERVTKSKCPHCKYETFVTYKYKRHLAGLHGVDTKGEPAPRHKCPHCPYETSAAWNYQTHLAGIHGITTKGEPATKHKCPHCHYETLAARNYQTHLSVTHGITTKGDPAPNYKCTHCEFRTTKLKTYSNHSVSVHGRTLKGEPVPRHKCPECDYSTHFIDKLNRHKNNTHAEERPFACELCNYAGKRKQNLARHIKTLHWEDGAQLK